jgi:poly(3-hydroxybutyrate) depolymerase
MLTGYSSGGFMATRWGFRNAAPWRAVSAIAGAETGGGKEYKAAIGRMSVFIECGERDPNLGICKQVFEKVKKDGFDAESKWVPGMEHSPIKPEAFDWIWERVASRLDAPAERVKRGRRAQQAKRWADAIAEFRGAAAGADEKAAKAAQAELAKLEKAAGDRFAEAEKKAAAGDKAAARKLYEEVARYAGLECASKAKEALKALE